MHHRGLENEKSPYWHGNEFMDSPLLGPIDLIVRTGPTGLEERVNLSQSYPVPSIESMTNQEKLHQSAASVTNPESPLLIFDGTLNDSASKSPMLASPGNKLSLAIDSKRLNDSDL